MGEKEKQDSLNCKGAIGKLSSLDNVKELG